MLIFVLTGRLESFAQGTQGTSSADTSLSPDAQPSTSADEVISALQQDPELRSELRRTVAEALRARGTNISEDQITDSLLYAQIQNDPTARARAADFVRNRGKLSDEQPEVSNDGKTPKKELNKAATPRPMETRRPRYEAPPEPVLKPDKSLPYTDIPSLSDLYKQLPRTDQPLERFGQRFFRDEAPPVSPADVPVGPDYVLGPGDTVQIILTGSINQTLQRVVDRTGRVMLPEVEPELISGKTVEQARAQIERSLDRVYNRIKVNLSVTRLRTVRVYVVGDVSNPGAYDLSSLATPLNAVEAAGGPTRIGSLRTVRHIRGHDLVSEIDLYDLMLKGVTGDFASMRSGDSIQVPPAGTQVAVTGAVKRPAIYELKGERSLQDVLNLAGGVLPSGRLNEIQVERIEAHERRTTVKLQADDKTQNLSAALSSFEMKDGDRVTVFSIAPSADATVYLEGHVLNPGRRPFSQGMDVRSLIQSYRELLPEPSEKAEIVRLAPPDLRPVVIQFNLPDALTGKKTVQLSEFDTVRIYGRYEQDAPKVSIYGEVVKPGSYPLGRGMTVTQLLTMAGGFKRGALTDFADLASYAVGGNGTVQIEQKTVDLSQALQDHQADVPLKAGDVLTIRQITGWTDIGASVVVSGEVARPGTYGIVEGEKLSSLLKRVGGLRPTAYPSGALFQREQVRELDKQSRETLIKRVEAAQPPVGGANAGEASALMAAFVAQRQQILSRLKAEPPSGRMVIRISSDISKWENTPADIELRAGDTLFIPKRPGFVLVHGQVNNPNAMTYVPSKNAGWYLRRAGGATDSGNKGKAFIIRADGSVVGEGSGTGWFRTNVLSTTLYPGDTVVIPEKTIGSSMAWRSLLTAAQLAANLAITARVVTSF
ncbi:MAG TPA: SLBB domain-containing protein [Terriglobales bacterium]|nr:SLBB domain-containing protein [Terriglobales bacterium]